MPDLSPRAQTGDRVSRVRVYTHLAAAPEFVFELDASKVSFQPIAGGDGVPPGMMLKEGEETILWVAAQDFGIAVVDDERLVSSKPPVVS